MIALHQKSDISKKSIVISPRELEIVKWVLDGKTNSEIALLCNIKERTIEYHLHGFREKLQATNTLNAVYKAAQMMLI